MKQSILNKKLPSLLAITIIITGIVFTTFLTQRTNILQSNASPGSEPKNLRITNVTDSSFTIVYSTDDSVIGTIDLGENPNALNQKFLDERDINSKKLNSYKSHSITVNNLKPKTDYFYKISSGEKITTDNVNPFKIKTGSKIDSPTAVKSTLQGKVINPDGSQLNDGIAILKTNDSNLISTLVKDGKFNLQLNTYKDDNSVIEMEIISGDLMSLVRISADQKSPLPVITLSNNYDFVETEPASVRIINSKSVKFPGFKSKLKTTVKTPISITPSISQTNPSTQ